MIRGLAVLAAALMIAACGNSQAQQGSASPSGTTPSPTPSPTVTSTAPAVPAAATPTPPPPPRTAAVQAVGMGPFAFSPTSLSIRVGTRVTFTNSTGVTHTFTARGGAFNSGFVAAGQSYTFVFGAAGSFPYYCTIHQYMNGTINVT